MKAPAWKVFMAATGYSALFPLKAAAILVGISTGVRIEFTGRRDISRSCSNLKITAEDEPKVDKVIQADVRAGKKAGPFVAQPYPHFSCSPIGAVPKREAGKIRVIHHLSYPRGGDSINASTVDEYHQLGTFDRATDFVRQLGPGCSLIKLDVEAAYKQVPVDPRDWPLLGFRWLGQYYHERVLPFGLKSSCRLWELYATALQHILERACGIRCVVHYVDDFLFVVKAREEATRQLASALSVCERLGVPMAPDKTEGPTTCLTFLGVEIDTVKMEARLSDERLKRLHSLLKDWEKKKTATITELHSLEGVLHWTSRVVRPGRSFLSRLRHWRKERGAISEGPHSLTAEVLADLRWWREFAAAWNGVSLLYELNWREAAKIELFTDACERGYGARYGNRWFEGAWSTADWNRACNPSALVAAGKKTRSMPFLELLALVFAASTWGHLWASMKIRFVCDCMPVVTRVQARHSPNQRSMGPIRYLCTLAARHGFDFDCVWIAGVTNVAADLLSRGELAQFRSEVPTADQAPTALVPLPPYELM